MPFDQQTAFDFLRRAHLQQRLGHAYLISGAAGSGKRALASALSGLVTGAEGNPLTHPDVHVAEPESKSRRIVVDQMRALERALRMRAASRGKKVAVIFDADRLQPHASNAFLKTLEEPPDNSLLLLTSDQPEALPDTILSRCIGVQLRRAGKAELSPEQAQLLETLCEFFRGEHRGVAAVYGLVRKFTVLLQQIRKQISDDSAADLKKEESAYRQTTESDWLDDREDFYKALTESRYVHQRLRLIDILLQWWADVLRQQQNFDALDLPGNAAETARLASQLSTQQVLERIAHLETLRENLGRNIKEDLAIEVAFLHAFSA